LNFAPRLHNVETSAIRELFKLLGRPGIVSFAGGFPDAALFDLEGLRAATECMLTLDPGGALQYGATEGYPVLREALSEFMSDKGVRVAPDGLLVTTGSQQALDLVGKTLVAEQSPVLVEAPTFLATIQCFRLYGAQLLGVPMDADGVQVEALEAQIARHRPQFVYLIPTFGNPSGATLSLERRHRILELAVRTQTVLIEDDPYGDLYFDQPPPPSLLALSADVPGSRELLVYCGSLSKVLSPGLRIGWMIAPPELLAKATMCKQFSDAHTSTFAQATAAQYLRSGRLGTTLSHMRAVYAERARTMCGLLQQHMGDRLCFTPPAGGLFVWGELSGMDTTAFARRAIDQGVAFVPGAPFYAEQPNHSALRLSFATVGLDKIIEGVARLYRAL
jgi:DNA-binding transcriptional MocR family regulator